MHGVVTAAAPAPPPAGDPRPVLHQRPMDVAAAQDAVGALLVSLGADPSSESLTGTPRRVAEMYAELLTPQAFNATTFPNDAGYDELVIVRDVQFSSLCEHHLLPFRGTAHVGYLPGDRIVGLSKLARLVGFFAKRLQVQERMTAQIADWLRDQLQPRGVGVVIEAEHLCMTVRGVQAAGSTTVTSTLYGVLRETAAARSEFLSLAGAVR